MGRSTLPLGVCSGRSPPMLRDAGLLPFQINRGYITCQYHSNATGVTRLCRLSVHWMYWMCLHLPRDEDIPILIRTYLFIYLLFLCLSISFLISEYIISVCLFFCFFEIRHSLGAVVTIHNSRIRIK